MTRAECEARLMEHMEAMVAILHDYNPECKYLDCAYTEADGIRHIHMNNDYFGDGEDAMRPINCFKRDENPIYSFSC